MNYIKKISLLLLCLMVFGESWGSSSQLTARAIRFDLSKMRNGLKPTVYRLADELTILVASLYKRRELDEVNYRSLIRIRAYLAEIYHQPNVPERLKKRAYMAIRQITAELQTRLDFEERYKAGLVGTKTSSTQTSSSGRFRDAANKVRMAQRFARQPQPAAGARNAQFRGAVRRVQNVNRAVRGMEPSSGVSGNFYNVRENRGRRLHNLIQSGYLSEQALNASDRQELMRYRQSIRVPGSPQRVVQAPPVRRQSVQAPTSRVPLAPPLSQPVSTRTAPQPSPTIASPLSSSLEGARQRLRPVSARQMASRPAPSGQRLRTDRILDSTRQQIERKMAAGQIDPNRKDPNDYRDQIQGASDEEWEAS